MLHWRWTPVLEFRVDRSWDYGNRIDSLPLDGSRVVSQHGPRAVVRWGRDEFSVDLDAAMVTFIGGVATSALGRGEAKCDRTNGPSSAKPVNLTAGR